MDVFDTMNIPEEETSPVGRFLCGTAGIYVPQNCEK